MPEPRPRKSLVDAATDSIGRKPEPGAGGPKRAADRVKVGLAIGALAIGLALIAWSQGAFDGLLRSRRAAVAPTPEQVREVEAQRIEQERLNRDNDIGGGPG